MDKRRTAWAWMATLLLAGGCASSSGSIAKRTRHGTRRQ